MTPALLSRTAGIPLRYANRHGLITGQTGTGKSVSLMRLAEQFSTAGVPVFVSDVKGDLSALSRSCPVAHLDLFGDTGTPLSVTVQAMGADLMARAIELSDVQAGCLEIAFAFATDNGLQLDTIADLRGVLSAMLADKPRVSMAYGQVTPASVGVVMRALLRLETQGGSRFFRAPCFDVADLVETPGTVSILDSVRLINSPRVYSAFLLWLLSDLWKRLPEIGDSDKPRLVFFFDEAHLLFQDCPSALLQRIEQTVRLIRSKGVGLYFVSQSPEDVPPMVREQLAFRVAHAREYRLGHAAFSGIDQNGRPMNAGVVRVELPACPLGPLSEQERPSPVSAEYAHTGNVGQFDRAGYAFLCAAFLFTLSAVAFVAWLQASGKLGAACAIAAGVFLAIRRKF